MALTRILEIKFPKLPGPIVPRSFLFYVTRTRGGAPKKKRLIRLLCTNSRISLTN